MLVDELETGRQYTFVGEVKLAGDQRQNVGKTIIDIVSTTNVR